jgi:hypothetical protein
MLPFSLPPPQFFEALTQLSRLPEELAKLLHCLRLEVFKTLPLEVAPLLAPDFRQANDGLKLCLPQCAPYFQRPTLLLLAIHSILLCYHFHSALLS